MASGSGWNLCVINRKWVWVESMGVVVRRYIDFLTSIPLVSALFCRVNRSSCIYAEIQSSSIDNCSPT